MISETVFFEGSMMAKDHRCQWNELLHFESLSQEVRPVLRERVLAKDFEGVLDAETVSRLAPQDASLNALMAALLPMAAVYARPPISKYRVGAVACGDSRALYLGANAEFLGGPLGDTLHAEPSAVLRAWAMGESGITRLAVTAPPCGVCRQFLSELPDASNIEILTPSQTRGLPSQQIPSQKLGNWLPASFGPSDLGFDKTFMESPCPSPVSVVATNEELRSLAIEAATRSYAPYSGCPSAAAIRFKDRRALVAVYVENAAFNPSISPVLALANLVRFKGWKLSDGLEAVLVEAPEAQVRHQDFARRLFGRVPWETVFLPRTT